jgi:hypothetical protein
MARLNDFLHIEKLHDFCSSVIIGRTIPIKDYQKGEAFGMCRRKMRTCRKETARGELKGQMLLP